MSAIHVLDGEDVTGRLIAVCGRQWPPYGRWRFIGRARVLDAAATRSEDDLHSVMKNLGVTCIDCRRTLVKREARELEES